MNTQLSLAPEAPIKARNQKVPLRRIEVEAATGADVDRDLVNSIRDLGVLEPVILELQGDNFSVIDGRRRTLAARAAGLKSIPARVIEIDGWLGRDVLSILLNEQRGPNPVSELLAIERLIQAGKSERDITKATGMDAATIRKRLKLARLIFALRIRLENGLLKVGLAEAIAVLPEALQE
jgi:ParB family transcriptional regulator, chromosome partitioning protein